MTWTCRILPNLTDRRHGSGMVLDENPGRFTKWNKMSTLLQISSLKMPEEVVSFPESPQNISLIADSGSPSANPTECRRKFPHTKRKIRPLRRPCPRETFFSYFSVGKKSVTISVPDFEKHCFSSYKWKWKILSNRVELLNSKMLPKRRKASREKL